MPGITLYSGNRLEDLADKMADLVSAEPLPVMSSELIMVQSAGMMKWLTRAMSERLGIWANCEYLFPNHMTSRILEGFFPGTYGSRYFDKELMTWRCMEVIRKCADEPLFGELAAYISGEITGLKLFQLSSKIVDLFDQYMTFRPDMILRWDRGDDEGWQSELWRRLTGDLPGEHPPALLEKLFHGLEEGRITGPENIPERITIFGVSYLPVYHLNVLMGASLFSDIHIFMLNPSAEYWGNILTEREKRRIITRATLIPGEPEDYLHLDIGNPLLSSLGRIGRDFLYNIFSSDIDPETLFSESGRSSLLSMVQDDIYSMRNGGGTDVKSILHVGGDSSIIVNSCHSAMREIEVLHDYILDLLNDGMPPHEILVMTPDIETYSAAIQGIFGRSGSGLPPIPFTIADRKLRSMDRGVEAFFKIISLGESRFTSSYIMGIAESPEVALNFGLTPEDVDLAGIWVREAAVHWGIDSSQKSGLGLPGIEENTWEWGIERMLMGSIMESDDRVIMGVLPSSGIEGSEMAILGRFISLCRTLFAAGEALDGEHRVNEWSEILLGIIDSLFGSEPDGGVAQISAALKGLKEIEGSFSFSGSIGIGVISSWLESVISGSGAAGNFMSGGITFCGMLPMRSIPSRVICLLGMGDSDFPRKSRPLSFDLTARSPKRGDRSARDEDRYLFLETLISARERLYISYTGRSLDNNGVLNPSVVVNELLEYIDENYSAPGGESLRSSIFREQRIQPYNPVYFIEGTGFYTYNGGRIGGARSLASGEKGEWKFFTSPLPPVNDDERNLTLMGLARFLDNPSMYMLNRRLGLTLSMRSDELMDEEPFSINSLEKFRLGSGILDSILNGSGKDEYFRLVAASGILPHGTPGRVIFDRSYSEVKSFHDSFSHLLTGREDEVKVDLNIGRYRVSGSIDNIYSGSCIFFRFAGTKGRDIIRAWVTHLALCSSGSFRGRTIVIAKDGVTGWEYIEKSDSILEELLSLYESGMTGPLPLFPSSSYSYAMGFYNPGKKEPHAAGISEAEKSFSPFQMKGDSSDPYIQKMFGVNYELSSEFGKAALSLYSPVFENMKSEEIL